MAWTRADDARCYDAADHLQRYVGSGWLIMWGPGSHRFWAYLCGNPHALILSAPDAHGLYRQIQQTGCPPPKEPR